MTVRKVEIERLSVISSKPFEEVLATLEGAIGHPDMVEFRKAMNSSHTFAEFENVVHKQLGTTGLMMFMKFDHGTVVRKEMASSMGPELYTFRLVVPVRSK